MSDFSLKEAVLKDQERLEEILSLLPENFSLEFDYYSKAADELISQELSLNVFSLYNHRTVSSATIKDLFRLQDLAVENFLINQSNNPQNYQLRWNNISKNDRVSVSINLPLLDIYAPSVEKSLKVTHDCSLKDLPDYLFNLADLAHQYDFAVSFSRPKTFKPRKI